MKYVIEMDSGGMTYILSFIMIGTGIPKLLEGKQRHIDSKVIS
jgi:hypothetical protein